MILKEEDILILCIAGTTMKRTLAERKRCTKYFLYATLLKTSNIFDVKRIFLIRCYSEDDGWSLLCNLVRDGFKNTRYNWFYNNMICSNI